jgi:hypothetical protein
MKKHTDTDIHFETDDFVITIDGTCRKFTLDKISPVLKNASEIDRNHFVVSPSGYGIHWPTLDEDLSIDGLLGIVHEPHHKQQAA